jgi:hypothetical protein
MMHLNYHLAIFLNALPAEQTTKIFKMCLEKCHDVIVEVLPLTFDGFVSNIATAKPLDYNFEGTEE